MGRKKLNTDVSDEVRGMELVAKEQQETQLSIAEIDKACLPDGEEYNFHISMSRARAAADMMASSLLSLGRELTLIHAHNPSEFETACESLGVARASAFFAVSAWKKFGQSTRVDFSILGNSKLRALTVLEDTDIEDLNSGNGINGLGTVDEIDKMPVRELKAKLRELKASREKEREDLEAVIASKNSKIDELERELRYQDQPTQEQKAEVALEKMSGEIMMPLLVAQEQMRKVQDAIARARKIDGVTTELLESWIGKQNENLSILNDDYEQMQDDIQNICPDRSEA